jgi:metal transporter CNNM
VLGLAKLVMLPLASGAPLHFFNTFGADEDLPKDSSDPSLWIYLSFAVALVLLGGVAAGLTIALMGQDETYLQVIATSGEGSEKRSAAKVLKLLARGKHWVLVTLLLSNVITNETLPIVLDRSLGGGWPAVVSSTVLIGMSIFEANSWASFPLLTLLQSSLEKSFLSPYACATVYRSARSVLHSSSYSCGS